MLDRKKDILRVIGKLIQAIKDLEPISSLFSHEPPTVSWRCDIAVSLASLDSLFLYVFHFMTLWFSKRFCPSLPLLFENSVFSFPFYRTGLLLLSDRLLLPEVLIALILRRIIYLLVIDFTVVLLATSWPYNDNNGFFTTFFVKTTLWKNLSTSEVWLSSIQKTGFTATYVHRGIQRTCNCLCLCIVGAIQLTMRNNKLRPISALIIMAIIISCGGLKKQQQRSRVAEPPPV